jgi:O-antigen/teichoic acid export membrane protein
MAGLAAKLIRGSFFRVLNPVLNIVVGLFMIPFVIGSIGDRWYGLWILVAHLVGYYGFLELGISTANERFIARALGQQDDDEIGRVFNSSLFLFTIVGFFSLLISIIIALISSRFVHDPAEIPIFRGVILLIGIDMAISFPARAFFGFLYAHVRYDIVNIFGISKLLVRTALFVYFLSRGFGIISMAIITLGVDIMQYSITALYTLKKHPSARLKFFYYSKETIRTLLGYSIYSFISNVAKQLRFHISSFVITAFLGLALVPHFNIGARIAGYYLLVITNAVALMKPVFSSLEGRGDFDQIRDKYIFTVKLNTIFSVFIGGSLLIYGKAFIARWMGADYMDSWDVLLVLTIGMIFNTIQITPVTLLYGISKHKFYSIVMVIEGVANILLSIILIRKYGIVGVAFGTTIPMLITSILIIPVYTNRVINMKLATYLKVVLSGILFGGIVHVCSWLLIRNYIVSSYSRILLLGLATSTVFIILSGFILLTRAERRYFKIPV